MKTISKSIVAATVCAVLGGPALADQFIVSLSDPISQVNPRVLETLRISIVDSFEHEGAHIAILDAPSEAYLETLFNVIVPKAHSVAALPVSWTGEAMGEIDTATRLKFGTEMDCGFCAS